MSQTAASLRRQLALAGDLATVVRTMKAMAAAGISQYEGAVQALDDYDRTVITSYSIHYTKLYEGWARRCCSPR